MTGKSIHSSVKIHPTAIVEDGATIGEGTVIGPYAIIKSSVILGKNNNISSHVIIEGETTIGDDNDFYSFSAIGSTPQVLDYRGGTTQLIIGNKNIIREYVTIQPGLSQFHGVTKVGDANLFMISSHIGHDCIIGNNNRFTNYVGVSGHVEIGNKVIISGSCGIHQYVRLGDYSFVGGGSMVTLDVPPFCMAQGNRATLVQINSLGLKRDGFIDSDILIIKNIFRDLFVSKEEVFSVRLDKLLEEHKDLKITEDFFSFINNSKRGICPYKSGLE